MRDRPQPIPEDEIAKVTQSESTRETIQELDLETRQRVASWSRHWLENFYGQASTREEDRKDFGAKLDFAHSMETEIAGMVGETDSFNQRLLAPRYREGVGVFLDTLIDFVADKASDRANAGRLRDFIGNIQESLFSFSPNISNQIGMENLLVATAKANRVPEAQGWFGQNMVGEMAYELSFCHPEQVDRIVEAIKKRPIGEVLDIIQQVETVAADALAQGDWADPAVDRSEHILAQLNEHLGSPLVRYSVDLSLERIKQEEDEPTLGVLTFHGNKQAGRLGRDLTRQQHQQHVELSGQINPDVPVEGAMLPIASDAVAIFDHSQIPRHLARVNPETLPKPEAISIVALRNAIETCRDPRRFRPEDLVNLITFINDRVVAPDKKTWSDISDRLSPGDWSTFFKAKQDFEALRQRYNQALRSGELESYTDRQLWESAEGHHLREAVTKIASAYSIFRPKLVAYLEGVESSLSKKLVPAHFESYNSIPQDHDLNPFAGSQDEQLALLLQHLHQPELRERIEQDLGINLTEIPLRSQIHLLRFLAAQNHQGFDRLRSTLQAHPEAGNKILNSFLAVAEDMQYSEAILKLAETLDEKTADAVFSKYEEIAAVSEQVRQYIAQTFPGQEHQVNDVVRSLLHRGNELLRAWAESAVQTTSQDMLQELEHIKTEILLFASTFKVVSEQQKLDLAEVARTSLEIKDSASLTEDEKRDMDRIFSDNRKGYSPALFKETREDFQAALHASGKEFQILRVEGIIVAYIRFDQLENGNLYAGSLNVRPEVKGSAIGSAMLRATLDKKAEERNIEAVVYSKNPMLKHYTSDFGFQIAGELPDYHGTGELFYKLFRPRQERQRAPS